MESVTTVELPSDELLLDMLPEPLDCVVMPPGPEVDAVTRPLPAETETPVPAGVDSPGLSSTTRQLELDETEAPGADEEEEEELLALCAIEAVLSAASAAARTIVFMAAFLN